MEKAMDSQSCFAFLAELIVTMILFVSGVRNRRQYTNSEIRERISDRVHSVRDRSILYRRLVDGIKFETLAEEFELSVRQVKKIVYRNEQVIFSE